MKCKGESPPNKIDTHTTAFISTHTRPIRSDFGYHILIVWERNYAINLHGVRDAWMHGVPEMYELNVGHGLFGSVYTEINDIRTGIVGRPRIFHPDPEPTMAPTADLNR